MGIFLGTKEYAVDDKGRVAVQVAFREDLKDKQLVAYRDLRQKCIKLMTYDEYIKLIEKYTKAGKSKNIETIMDRLVGKAEYTKLDSQGRITISQPLRQNVQITKEKSNVFVIGKYNEIEIWSVEVKNAEDKAIESGDKFYHIVDEVDQDMSDKGIV